jgi:predicted metal-binding protein
VADSIEYELVNWEAREVWKCQNCGHYRHRPVRPGQLPAICCGQPAKFIDRYEQPFPVRISETFPAPE